MLQHLVLKDSVLRHSALKDAVLRHPVLSHPILSAAALILVSAGSGAVLAPSAAAAISTPTPSTPITSTSTPAAGTPTASTTSAPAASTPTATPATTTSATSTPATSTPATRAGTSSPTTTGTPSPTASTPGPATTASLSVPTLTLPGPKKAIPWPSHGRARLEVAGLGVLGHSGSSARSVPIASVTKVMTAYVILRDHPLAAGQDGPTIVVTKAEAASYARRKAAGESLVKVAAGEKINERQALQGLLLASGNNMADILGRWDAGGTQAFVATMNQTARLLGLTSTHYADTSGLDPRSRSSATDLLKLAPAAMADPTFAEIVAETSATIPHNKLKNTNRLLGRHGVIGIKTGSTRAAGGCLLFAAERTVSGRVYTIYGTVLGAPGPRILTNALARSDALIVAARRTLHEAVLIPSGRTVASLRDTDGSTIDLTVASDLTVVGWPGLTYRLSLPPDLAAGQVPRTLTVRTAVQTITVPLVPLSRA